MQYARQTAGALLVLFVFWNLMSMPATTDLSTYLGVIGFWVPFVPAFFLPRRWLWLGLALISLYLLAFGLYMAYDLYRTPHPKDNIIPVGFIFGSAIFALCAFLSRKQRGESQPLP